MYSACTVRPFSDGVSPFPPDATDGVLTMRLARDARHLEAASKDRKAIAMAAHARVVALGRDVV